jgi:hypothetical protein
MFQSKLKNILLVVLVLCILPTNLSTVYAYDFNAKHPDINKEVSVEDTKLYLWKYTRSKGYSEQATAGLMGNFFGESSYNYNRVEEWANAPVERGDFSYFSSHIEGKYGVGLVQWTSAGRQAGLFGKCDELGTQWTDLGSQLAYLYDVEAPSEGGGSGCTNGWWDYNGHYPTLDDFKKSQDIELAMQVFLRGFERAGVEHYDKRLQAAKEAYDTYKGTDFSDLSAGATTNDSEVEVDSNFLVLEWDLVGMPDRSGFLDGAVALPTVEALSGQEAYSLSIIKENIQTANDNRIYDIIRQSIVTIGLLLIMYGLILSLAFFFDRISIVIDFSLVSVLTGGKITPVFDNVETYNQDQGYMSWIPFFKRMTVVWLVGFFIISGGVFSVIVAPTARYIQTLSM